MATPVIDPSTQVIQQELAAEQKPTRWGSLALLVLIAIVFVVWLIMDATFRIDSRTDKVKDYFHAIEAEPYHQVLNTRYQLLEPCEEVADMADCMVEEQNDLFDRAGLNVQFKAMFTFDEDNSILWRPLRTYSFWSNYVVFPPPGWENPFEFQWLYRDWLERSHPDVYRQLPVDGWGDCCAEAQETAVAFMAYIDEFLAESETYPLP